ncbi:MAG: sulfotransferase [Parvularculaceae bacterium]
MRPDARATAAYALGDAAHRRGMRADAFGAWARANEHKTSILKGSLAGVYDPAKQERFTRLLTDVFARDPLGGRHAAAPAGEPTPIFIIGMPRSGTTLLENALAAHPMVAGGGELPALPYILDEIMAVYEAPGARSRSLDEETRSGSREMYFRQIKEFRLDALPFLTDKQPTNFLSVGLIRVLFPQARIIHIRRKPLDTGFSIYRRNFSKRWPFAFGQRDIAHYYGQYARLMDHWRRNYPDAVAFVQYEELVEDFEGELRRLIDWCGLPWDQNCVDYQNSERNVITFSAVQVRKGASKAHSGSAEPYTEYLQPMAEALAAAGVDLQTGDLAHPSE